MDDDTKMELNQTLNTTLNDGLKNIPLFEEEICTD